MKKIFTLLAFIMLVLAINAQNRNSLTQETDAKILGFDPNKLTYGGNFGFGFGDNSYLSLYLSPQVGYQFTNKINAGAGFSYSFSKEKSNYLNYNWKYNKNYLGFNLFSNFYPYKNIILTARPEILRMWEKYTQESDGKEEVCKRSRFIPAFVIGGGLHLRPFTLTLNYDLVQNDDSPYGNNVYFGVGFFF